MDLCGTMTHVKELNLADLLRYTGCDEVLRVISVSMPKLQELNIACCSVSVSAIDCQQRRTHKEVALTYRSSILSLFAE